MKQWLRAAAGSVILAGGAAAVAQMPAWVPSFAPDGTVRVPAFELPPSALSSPEARALQAERGKGAGVPAKVGDPDIAIARQALEDHVAPQLKLIREMYPANVVEQHMAGVRTRVITPKTGSVDPRRVLINLHGGGFYSCADGCGLMESMPIAVLGGFKVISVDYRQGPEHAFPAASEDVAAVYGELLKTYRPKQIGIYGCSAGGALSAQAAAWLPAHGLPQAGAIGIFGAGGVRFGAGDSSYITARTDGSMPPPATAGQPTRASHTTAYFRNARMDDPMISPAMHPKVAAQFPPTLIITGSRAFDMSPAIVTHSKLLDAGVRSQLIVGEAMEHCYMYRAQLPEAQTAYREIVKFFRANLDAGGRGASASAR